MTFSGCLQGTDYYLIPDTSFPEGMKGPIIMWYLIHLFQRECRDGLLCDTWYIFSRGNEWTDYYVIPDTSFPEGMKGPIIMWYLVHRFQREWRDRLLCDTWYILQSNVGANGQWALAKCSFAHSCFIFLSRGSIYYGMVVVGRDHPVFDIHSSRYVTLSIYFKIFNSLIIIIHLFIDRTSNDTKHFIIDTYALF